MVELELDKEIILECAREFSIDIERNGDIAFPYFKAAFFMEHLEYSFTPK